jgi:hypothetical protein
MPWYIDHRIFEWRTMLVPVEVWRKAGLKLPKDYPYAFVGIGDQLA